MMALLRSQWFVLALVGAVVLAFEIPEWGVRGGKLRSEITTQVGIIVVFFLQGWLLPSEVLGRCLLRWKAHVFTQAFIFVVYPAWFLIGDLLWAPYVAEPLRLGFFFLAVVPTTITSAIIYTAQSEGDTAVALVNTTVANLAGVFVTPLWMTVFLSVGGGGVEHLGEVLLKLIKLILLPFFVGQVAHALWKSAVPVIKKPAGFVNQGIIIFIVFASFSNSVDGGVWQGQGLSLVLVTTVICLVLFLSIVLMCQGGIRLFGFTGSEVPAIFFCSTQKTLAAAVPLGISLFGSDPAFGVVLLPVMVYHPIQLILGSMWIHRFKRRSAEMKA